MFDYGFSLGSGAQSVRPTSNSTTISLVDLSATSHVPVFVNIHVDRLRSKLERSAVYTV